MDTNDGRIVDAKELHPDISPAHNPSDADRITRMMIAAMAKGNNETKNEAFEAVMDRLAEEKKS